MARKKKILSPTYYELIEPVFKALVELDGSGSNDEICETIIRMLKLPDSVVDEPHKGAASQRTELEYQLAWARTYLKKYGAISNSSRGVWMITPEFADKKEIDAKAVIKFWTDRRKNDNNKGSSLPPALEDDNPENDGMEVPEELEPWRTELAETLHTMNPFAFERLAQLLLRECGFSQVIVTKKTGDGGY